MYTGNIETGSVTNVAVKKQYYIFRVCVCSLNYPARRAQAPYYRGAGKSVARPTSRRIMFAGENISFDASLVIYINSTNIPPVTVINRIYETQILLSL